MPFTVIGWNEHTEDAPNMEALTAAADQSVRVVGNQIWTPALSRLVFAFARGLDIQQARFESPSLRRVSYLEIDPMENLIVGADKLYPSVMYQGSSPLPMVKDEALEAHARTGVDQATYQTVCMALADGPLTPVTGEIWTVRFTAAPDLVESAWANAEIVFDEALPVGRYQIVGACVWGFICHAFRLVPVGAINRPGGPMLYGAQQDTPPWMRKGGIGVWCEFETLTPPSIDVLGNDAGVANIVGHLDLIKVA